MSYVFSKDIIAVVHFMEPIINDSRIHGYVMLPNVDRFNQDFILKYRKVIEQHYKHDDYLKWMIHMDHAKQNKPNLYNEVVRDAYSDEELMKYMKARIAEYKF